MSLRRPGRLLGFLCSLIFSILLISAAISFSVILFLRNALKYCIKWAKKNFMLPWAGASDADDDGAMVRVEVGDVDIAPVDTDVE